MRKSIIYSFYVPFSQNTFANNSRPPRADLLSVGLTSKALFKIVSPVIEQRFIFKYVTSLALFISPVAIL